MPKKDVFRLYDNRGTGGVIDLSTSYMGIDLKNPLVVASSGLTSSVGGVEKCARAGAGCVVLKSLFEEQIDFELGGRSDDHGPIEHPEGEAYLRRMGKQLGPADYLDLIRETRRILDIPVIASVNCVSAGWWTDWTEQIEDAGASAIELNISVFPRTNAESAHEVESRFFDIVGRVTGRIGVPVAVKIGPHFTALPHFAAGLVKRGISGLVLFNRFYQLDVDVDSIELVAANYLSTPSEIQQSIRWTSILSDEIGCDIAAGTGVEDGNDVVKLLLAGARVVQVCSTLYRNGHAHLTTLLNELRAWMERGKFYGVDEFRGRLSQAKSAHPQAYERLQYIKALTGLS